jgi:hypothetical protein
LLNDKTLIIAPKIRTVVDCRNLVRICEQQAALCADPRAREELKAMAREYRVSAEWQERQQTAEARGRRFAKATTGEMKRWRHDT